MKEYLFDMHIHTSETSFCAKMCAKDVCDNYKKFGYDGIVITDHVNAHTFESVLEKPWHEQADKLLKGYREAKKQETEDFKVLFGLEMRCAENKNDYLVYGLTEKFIYEHKNLQLTPTLKDFLDMTKDEDIIIFQAHPFRKKMVIIDPKLVDGIEVFNDSAEHDSNNELAKVYAEKYKLKTICGSDYHGIDAKHKVGLYFKEFPQDEKELVSLLRNGEYRLKLPEY